MYFNKECKQFRSAVASWFGRKWSVYTGQIDFEWDVPILMLHEFKIAQQYPVSLSNLKNNVVNGKIIWQLNTEFW